MATTFFNFRCLPVSHCFFVAIFLSLLVTLNIIQFKDLWFLKIGAHWEIQDPILGDVYHSAEVFRMNYAEMERKFKIYAYPNADGSGDYRTISGKYASEGYFFKNIRESSFLTNDPNRADLFFIPLSCHKLHQKVAFDEMPSVVGKYVETLIHKYPYWNRSLGADHFFLTCHDIDVQATEAVSLLVKNSIRVVCSAGYNTGFIPHKDVSLPMVVQPFTEPIADQVDIVNRTILGYWEGLSNTDLTEMLINLWGEDEELNIQSRRRPKTSRRMEKFYASKFCICPAGSRVTSSRITMAIHYGCVPVIFADYYDLPFNDVLNWRKFSIALGEADVFGLKWILKIEEGTNYAQLRNKLIKVQRHFQWNTPPVKYDAFHMVLYELWTRRSISRH